MSNLLYPYQNNPVCPVIVSFDRQTQRLGVTLDYVGGKKPHLFITLHVLLSLSLYICTHSFLIPQPFFALLSTIVVSIHHHRHHHP